MKGGAPSCVCRWLRKKKAKAEKEKAAKLAKRSDAKLANVIICERWDKKAAKFTVPELPFPYTQNNVRTSPPPGGCTDGQPVLAAQAHPRRHTAAICS